MLLSCILLLKSAMSHSYSSVITTSRFHSAAVAYRHVSSRAPHPQEMIQNSTPQLFAWPLMELAIHRFAACSCLSPGFTRSRECGHPNFTLVTLSCWWRSKQTWLSQSCYSVMLIYVMSFMCVMFAPKESGHVIAACSQECISRITWQQDAHGT